ncbi:MAG: T9SS type A sorting domain-containing protein, partial [Flavobacteriales bacterium]|nr:T9SS type A sorting domain-containing protein [Flavobacteriales bacterium]
NSATGIGTFTLCSTFFNASTCDYGPGPYSLCSTFKADYVAANAYTFDFTSTTTFETFSKTKEGSTFLTLSAVPGLKWGDTYDVEITALYYYTNTEGQPDTLSISTQVPCGMSIIAQPLAELRASDRCDNGPRYLGSSVAATPFICSAIDYKWTFTRTDVPELPIVHYRGAANRFLNLNSVTGLVAGGTYDVTIAPVFTGGDGNDGAVQCLSIVGPGMIETVAGNEIEAEFIKNITTEIESGFNIYPNPSSGEAFMLHAPELDEEFVFITVNDYAGRTVYQARHIITEDSDIVIVPQQQLASGYYILQLHTGNSSHSIHMAVMH